MLGGLPIAFCERLRRTPLAVGAAAARDGCEEGAMTERESRTATWDWLSPSAERLYSKSTTLKELQKRFAEQSLSTDQQYALQLCEQYLRHARGFLDRPAVSLRFPFFSRRHPHLVWELLHRVDEHHILLLADHEIYSKAVEVRTAFDLNIRDEKTRSAWIGRGGRLDDALETLQKHPPTPSDRDAVKSALQLVNEQVDRTFWQLSANTLTSVSSALLLALLMWLAWTNLPLATLTDLGSGELVDDYKVLIVLGAMGAYVSNLITRENFLFVRGGPFLRYWLHNVVAKPVVSVFAAVFIYVVGKSELLFSINPTGAVESPAPASELITFNVSEGSSGYVYAVLAVVSAIAADKLLRSTIDGVLKRMLQKAEKTVESGTE